MDNLQEYIRNQFDGILVFGDVHGDYESIKRAYDYAVKENFFFMSLGDLVDRSRNPYDTVKLMHDVIYEGRGGIAIGNHDDKFIRYAKGANVSFSADAKQTLADVGSDRQDYFLDMYITIADTPIFSALYHQFDDITLVHAASHPAMWQNNSVITKTEKSIYTVGETNGDRYDDGFPVRTYGWIDDIPYGKTVIVGHDKQPIYNIPITHPMVIDNNNGGRAIFADTGGGKNGFLSGVVIMPDKNRVFKVTSFVNFKE